MFGPIYLLFDTIDNQCINFREKDGSIKIYIYIYISFELMALKILVHVIFKIKGML